MQENDYSKDRTNSWKQVSHELSKGNAFEMKLKKIF